MTDFIWQLQVLTHNLRQLEVNDTYNYQLAPKVELNTQLSEARIIIGYRFNKSGFVQKISNQMDNIIKL